MKHLATLLIIAFTIFGLMNGHIYAQIKKKNDSQREVSENYTHVSLLNKTLVELSVESFEGTTFPPENWQKVTNEGGAGWQQGEVGSRVPGFPEGSVIDTPPGGGNNVAVCTWITGDADSVITTGQPTDQWLITPKITNIQNGDSLKFYLKYFKQFGDNLDVNIITTRDTIAANDTVNAAGETITAGDTVTAHVDTILVKTLSFSGAGNNNWQQYSVALTDSVEAGADIFIAFREHVLDNFAIGDALFLDLVEVRSLVTGVAENPQTPNKFELSQNYPNPFNPATKISFNLPHNAEVTLTIFNLLGQKVATLIEHKQFSQGQHKIQFDAAHLPSGIYYYRIEAGRFVDVKKMTLLK